MIMNDDPICSPTVLDSDDGILQTDEADKFADVCISGRLSTECSDAETELVPDGENVVNSGESVGDACEEKLTALESDDACDELADVESIHELIFDCQQTGSTSLDLCRRGLQSFCHKLLKLSQLQVAS